MTTPIHVYLHAASMGDHWREIVAELVGMIDGSLLYDASSSLRCVVVGGGPTRYLASRGMPRWETIEYGGSVSEYEYPTLRMLWQHAQTHPEGRFLYLHSKGASCPPEGRGAYSGKRCRDRWRRLMAYHAITRWRERVADLDHVDGVGCFWDRGPLPHFAGNFWWARGDHLQHLPEPAPQHPLKAGGEHPRLWAELWLQASGGRFKSCYELSGGMKTEMITGRYRQTN